MSRHHRTINRYDRHGIQTLQKRQNKRTSKQKNWKTGRGRKRRKERTVSCPPRRGCGRHSTTSYRNNTQCKTKAHSYRRAFFPKIPKFGNNWRYVSIYGGILSLFVKFCRSKNLKFVTIPILKKRKQENMEDWRIARKKCRNFGKEPTEITGKPKHNKEIQSRKWITFEVAAAVCVTSYEY